MGRRACDRVTTAHMSAPTCCVQPSAGGQSFSSMIWRSLCYGHAAPGAKPSARLQMQCWQKQRAPQMAASTRRRCGVQGCFRQHQHQRPRLRVPPQLRKSQCARPRRRVPLIRATPGTIGLLRLSYWGASTLSRWQKQTRTQSCWSALRSVMWPCRMWRPMMTASAQRSCLDRAGQSHYKKARRPPRHARMNRLRRLRNRTRPLFPAWMTAPSPH